MPIFVNWAKKSVNFRLNTETYRVVWGCYRLLLFYGRASFIFVNIIQNEQQ